MRKKLLIVLICLSVISCVAGIAACKKTPEETPPSEENYAVDPEIISAPSASKIVVGESTDISVLSGEFSVEGELKFTDEATVPLSAGTVEREWQFIPSDTESYNTLSGKVEIPVYRYKLTYEENGGFELEDEYFNESYTLKNKPLTAKNEYHFDGWALAEDSTDYIGYPLTFTESATLYAGYRFHTADKLVYKRDITKRYTLVAANWQRYWENLGEYENAENNAFPRLPYTASQPEGVIEGEVIIADMYDDRFVTDVTSFSNTKITSIVFSNYTITIYNMNNTLLETVTIPNTATYVGDEAFQYNSQLTTVKYEGGESAVGWVFESQSLEFGYKLRTM